MRNQLVRLLWLTPTVLSVAYFALWACAPDAFLRPPLSPQGPDRALGGAAVISHSQSISEAPAPGPESGMGGQFWYQRRWSHVGFGIDLAWGSEGLAVGSYFRVHLVETPRMSLALDLQGGFAYAGIALPVVLRFGRGVEAYTAPGYLLRRDGALRLPVGVLVEADDALTLIAEGGAGIGTIDGKYDRLSKWGALGLGFPYGRRVP